MASSQRQAALDLFRQWIIKALHSKSKGDGAAYWKLVDQIEAIRVDADKVAVFSLCVSHIDSRAHEALLMQLLGLSLWTCTPAVASALLDFAVNLGCVRPSCLPLSLDFMVRSFMPPSCGIPAFMGLSPLAAASAAPSQLQQQQQLALAIADTRGNKTSELQQKQEVLERVQSALLRLLGLVPQAHAVLSPIMASRLPHRRLDKEFQCTFFEALFAVAEGQWRAALSAQALAPQHLQGEVHVAFEEGCLAAAIDHLIHMDVEIRWEDILEKQQLLGEAEEEDDRTGGAGVGGEDGEDGGVRGGRGARAPRSVYMFHMDLDDPSDDECVAAPHLRQSSASGPGSEAAALHGLVLWPGRSGEGAVAVVDEMADKMDSLMDLTFRHIQRRASAGPEAAMHVYRSLERCFDATILDTHKSKFTQFLLFYACSLPLAPQPAAGPAAGAPSGAESREPQGEAESREAQGEAEVEGGPGGARQETPPTATAFVAHLLALLKSAALPTNRRLSAAAYLASFLARAAYVGHDVVLQVLADLTAWCLDSLAAEEEASAARSADRSATTPRGKASKALRTAAKSLSAGAAASRRGSPESSTGTPGVNPDSSLGPLSLRSTLSSPGGQTWGAQRTPSPPHTQGHWESGQALTRVASTAAIQPPPTAPPALGSQGTSLRAHLQALPGSPSPAVPRTVLQGTCQAVLYILCFRLRDIAAEACTMEALASIPLQALLRSPLQPLVTSLESIASEFSRQAAHLGILGLGDAPGATSGGGGDSQSGVVSSSPRMRLHFGDAAGQGRDSHQALALSQEPERLDMFFPFDPYLLRSSLRHIRPLFNPWRQPYTDGGEAEEEEEEEEEACGASRGDGESEGDEDMEEWSSEDESERRDSFREGSMGSVGGASHDRMGPHGSTADKIFQRLGDPYGGISPSDFSPSSFSPSDHQMMSCTPPLHLSARLPAAMVKRV